MKVAIVGCAHGELDKIYYTASQIERRQNEKIDLLICCGDFQATRNESDLRCMAVPEKFYNMGSFYRYYSGEEEAPILTIFIGGNHEASNYLQELPFGGWVAPKIYYMGYAGVVNVGNLRIGGLSGIFKPFDYMKGHHELTPYNNETKRSVYHVRNIEVFRLKQISGDLDIMLSHDWPRGVYNHGDTEDLLKKKPFFKKEVNENKLGSEPCEELLYHLKPKYWFSAHLHTKFSALIPHNCKDQTNTDEDIRNTKFLALDKCLPRRKYIEVIDIPSNGENSEIELSYDLEWLTILYLTDHLMSSKRTMQYMPGPTSNERWSFTPTAQEKEFVFEKMGKDLKIPLNFEQTTQAYHYNYHGHSNSRRNYIPQPRAALNPQTIEFCRKLGIKDPLTSLMENISVSNHHESPVSTPEKGENTFSSFINDTSEYVDAYDNTPVKDDESTETSGGEQSQSEDSYAEPNSSTVTDYSSFIDQSSISNRLISDFSSTPDTTGKKRKFDFPSFKEPAEVSSSDMLPFQIDRAGDEAVNRETPITEKRQFKRRNANMYQTF